MREIVLTRSLPVDIGRGTVQTAAERAHVNKWHRNDLETKLIELFHLFCFLGIHTDGFGIQHQRIHGKPGAAE